TSRSRSGTDDSRVSFSSSFCLVSFGSDTPQRGHFAVRRIRCRYATNDALPPPGPARLSSRARRTGAGWVRCHGRGAVREAGARLRAQGVSEQDRARALRRRRREAAARAHPRVLRLLRLAFLGARPLAAGALGAYVPRRTVRRAGAASPGPELDARARRGRGALPGRSGAGLVRAALRARLAAPTRRRAPRMGRSAGEGVVRRAGSAGARGGGAALRLAAEALAADPHRRARPDGVRVRAGARLGADGRGPRDGGSAALAHRGVLPRGPRLPAQLRALRAGLPLSLPRRGRPPTPGARAAALRGVARGVPAAAPAGRRRRLARAGGGDRSGRPQARPPRRPEPQPRLDAGGHRLRPAGGGSAAPGGAGRRGAPPRGGAAVGDRRALRGRPLAGK